jgi:hypothetical protein
MSDKFIIEIALTHDHFEGQRTPDYFQAMLVPLGADGDPDWSYGEPICGPLAENQAGEIDGRDGPVPILDLLTDGFNKWLEELDFGLATGHSLADVDRIEWGLEGPDDCAVCPALAQQELVSQGRLS